MGLNERVQEGEVSPLVLAKRLAPQVSRASTILLNAKLDPQFGG
jgi:hypothetical protein